MKKFILYIGVTVLLVIIILSALFFYNINKPQSEKSWRVNTRPFVYVNECIYYKKGGESNYLPDEWEYYGSIVREVSGGGNAAIAGDLCSNIAKIGSRVFVNKNNLHKIYVEFYSNGTKLYSLFEDKY